MKNPKKNILSLGQPKYIYDLPKKKLKIKNNQG